MTPRELLDRASILNVAAALGLPEPRHGRIPAVWRGGGGHNVSLDDGKGAYYDHTRGEGGGILDLVQAATGCDRRGALQWLANHLSVTLDDTNPLSPAEKRDYAARLRRAKAAAEELAEWRESYLYGLTQRRNSLWDSGRRACALGLRLLREEADDSPLWSDVWAHCLDDLAGDEVDAELQRVQALGPREIIAWRAEIEAKKAAA